MMINRSILCAAGLVLALCPQHVNATQGPDDKRRTDGWTEFVANQWNAPLSYKGATCRNCYIVWRSKLDIFDDALEQKCPNCILREDKNDTTKPQRPCSGFQTTNLQEVRPYSCIGNKFMCHGCGSIFANVEDAVTHIKSFTNSDKLERKRPPCWSGRCNELGFTDAQGYYDLYKGNNIVTITSEEQWHDILNNKTPMTREEFIRKFSRDNKNFYQDNYDLTAAARAREKIQRDLKKLNAMIRQVQAKQKQEENAKAAIESIHRKERSQSISKDPRDIRNRTYADFGRRDVKEEEKLIETRPRSRWNGENTPEPALKPVTSHAIQGRWIPDGETIQCMVSGCPRLFNVFYRKHHCRACGLVICGKCSIYGKGKPRRCRPCVNLHKPVIFSTKADWN